MKENIFVFTYSVFILPFKEYLFLQAINTLHFLMQSYLNIFEVIKVNKR